MIMLEEENPLRDDMMEGGELYESVSDNMLDIAGQFFEKSPPKQTQYTAMHFNSAMLLGGVFNAHSSACAESLKKCKDVRVIKDKIDDLHISSDEWVRCIFAKMQAGASIQVLKEEVTKTILLLEEKNMVPAVWDLAIDMHLIPRYDKKPNPNLIKGREKSGTKLFERHITIQSIVPGRRLTLGSFLVPALADVACFVGMLIAQVQDMGLEIGTVMVDREFFSVKVLQTFVNMGVSYLVPCRNTDVVVADIEEFAQGKRDKISEEWLTSSTDQIKYNMIITERRRRIKGTRRKKEGSTLEDMEDVFDSEPDEPPHQTYIAFATNDSTINVEEYARRWGIETGYRMLESARPRTRSTNQEARTFGFVYAILMFNAWVIFNIMHVHQDEKKFEKWDGTPQITQLQMRMRILFFVVFSMLTILDDDPQIDYNKKPPPLPAG